MVRTFRRDIRRETIVRMGSRIWASRDVLIGKDTQDREGPRLLDGGDAWSWKVVRVEAETCSCERQTSCFNVVAASARTRFC